MIRGKGQNLRLLLLVDASREGGAFASGGNLLQAVLNSEGNS